MHSKKPLVSALILTYNHQDFIEDSLMGVIDQEGSFNLELIVANDNSKDQTGIIIKRIIKLYSSAFVRVKYICKDKNVGITEIVKEALRECRGDYIAVCEGDDYWTDPYKIQKQIKFLNENLEYIICGSKVTIKRLNGEEEENKKKIGEISFLDSLYKNQFSTCSVVIRKQRQLEIFFLKNFDDFYIKDWPLWTSLLKYGKGYNLKEVTATYNEHKDGIFSGKALDEKLNFFLKDRMLMLANFPEKKFVIKLYGYKTLLLYLKNSILKKEYFLSLNSNRKLIYSFLKA